METSERIGWILLGCVIGFVLGYVVRALKDIEEKVHHVEEVVNEDHQLLHRDEDGLARYPLIMNTLLLLVVLLTVWAAISTGRVNNQLEKTLTCLEQYNTRQGLALKSRDESIKTNSKAEIALWTQYNRLYKLAKSDPTKIPVVQDQLNAIILECEPVCRPQHPPRLQGET
jgi:hypothetical protein